MASVAVERVMHHRSIVNVSTNTDVLWPSEVITSIVFFCRVMLQYVVRVDMKRSLLNKDLQKQCEFIIEYKVKHNGAS